MGEVFHSAIDYLSIKLCLRKVEQLRYAATKKTLKFLRNRKKTFLYNLITTFGS